jgi:hypothetical protein
METPPRALRRSLGLEATTDLAQRRQPGLRLDGTPRKIRRWAKRPENARPDPAPKPRPSPHRVGRLKGAARISHMVPIVREELRAEAGLPDIVLPVVDRTLGATVDTYRPEFCDAVVEYMGQGYTLAAFAGAIGVSKRCLEHWGHRHPEFVDAVHVGMVACQKWWEDQLHEVATKGTHTSGRVTAILFALKNRAREDWTEVQRHEISGPGGLPLMHREPQLDTSKLSVEELVALEQLTTKALPTPDSEAPL